MGARVLGLPNDRTSAANSDADLIGRMYFWSTLLAGKGLHTEAMVMREGAVEIEILREDAKTSRRKRVDIR